jgi:hypothetical protein
MSGELRDAMRRTEERKQAAGLPQVSQLEGDDFMAMVRRIFVGLDLDIEEVLELSAEQRARAMGTVMLSGLGPGLLGAAFWLEGLLAGLLLMDARNLEIDGGGGTTCLASLDPVTEGSARRIGRACPSSCGSRPKRAASTFRRSTASSGRRIPSATITSPPTK